MYPGTNGKTHGERNENTPATNAAMGRGNEEIIGFISLDSRIYSIVIAPASKGIGCGQPNALCFQQELTGDPHLQKAVKMAR